MNKSHRPILRALSACALAALLVTPLRAAPVIPPNLANGLDELVSSNLALKQANGKRAQAKTFTSESGKAYATEQAARIADDAITTDNGDRLLVRAHLNGLVSLDTASAAIAARVPSFTTVAVDSRYKGGVIEGYVSLDDVPNLAYSSGVMTVVLEYKPELNRTKSSKAVTAKIAPQTGPIGEREQPGTDVVTGQMLTPLGTAFDQGVFQHRVDLINKYYNPAAPVDYEGAGIQVGFISDSFNSNFSVTTASQDVANFDLPGAGNNPAGNTQPVVVLQDITGGTDEGRGMGQIIYKMAPKARIGFATAFISEVGFANNIRALAALPGFSYPPATQQGFKADVICDDVGYGDEPFFEDGIIGQAVDDVAAAGVAYFSSAGNDIGSYDYDSDFRLVPVANAFTGGVLTGTNISLANVPSNLYQGGFHNYRTDGGTDLAMTVNVLSGTSTPQTNFQWDDPFLQAPPVITPAIYHNTGNHPGSGQQTYTLPQLTVGTRYVLTVTAQQGSSFDAIVTLKDPSGAIVINQQDTGTDETLQFTATSSACCYTVIVESFGGSTGPYNVDLYLAAPSPQVTTDFNILVFDVNGNYLPNSSLVTNNISSNIPQEFRRTNPAAGQTQVQYVICRSNNPPASPQPASHFRWIIRGNGLAGIGPAEYVTINTPNTKGHAMARGCNGTAAYPVFRPSINEYFTSPGPATVYFDKNGNRLSTPEVRLQPRIGAADGGNTSMFGGDSASDIDTKPNFSGTSAAAPHAAGVAALVLQAKGGPGSVTPAQMTNLLQRSTFIHDLDPYAATGVARTSLGGKVSIRVDADRGLNPSSGAFNPNSITVSYVGPGTLSSLVFNPNGLAAEGGAVTAGNNGLDASNTYFSNIYPGIIFQPLPAGGRTSGTFVFGNGSVGLTAADVVPSFSNLAPAPSNGTTQFWTMSLNFPNTNFSGGKLLRFTTGHAQQHDSTVQAPNNPGPTGGVTGVNTTQADLFGGGVLIPDGTVTQNGLLFNGTTSGGGTFSGRMMNRLGAGWTPVDGFGFLNAEAATMAPVQ